MQTKRSSVFWIGSLHAKKWNDRFISESIIPPQDHT